MASVKQTTKRSYGSGGLYERSPGVFLIRWRDNAGKRDSDTIKGNRKKAEAELTKRRISMETGSFSGKKKLTVAHTSKAGLRHTPQPTVRPRPSRATSSRSTVTPGRSPA